MQATKKQAKQLGDEWSQIKFVKNTEGKRVMRLELEHATVDVLEQETEEATDGNGNPE